MRAIGQYEFGGPEVLVVEQMPDLVPASGQVVLAVQAAGVHLVDTSIRSGETGGPFPIPELPMTPGREVAGFVESVGPDVDPDWIGRAVVAHLGPASGGYASQAIAPASALITADGVDAAEAVAMVGTGRTTLGVLDEAVLTGDDVVLVTAAAGGIGSLLVQAASNLGAFTVGLAGGATKVELVESLGADVAFDYLEDDWPARVRSVVTDRLGRSGVTAVLDGVGGEIGRAAFELIAPGGRIVMFGYTSGTPIQLDAADLFARGVAVTAAIGPRMFARPGGIQALAERAVAELARGAWRPRVTTFHLDEAPTAHRALVERRTTGKVVLIP